jgi:hypothetical protein
MGLTESCKSADGDGNGGIDWGAAQVSMVDKCLIQK